MVGWTECGGGRSGCVCLGGCGVGGADTRRLPGLKDACHLPEATQELRTAPTALQACGKVDGTMSQPPLLLSPATLTPFSLPFLFTAFTHSPVSSRVIGQSPGWRWFPWSSTTSMGVKDRPGNSGDQGSEGYPEGGVCGAWQVAMSPTEP
ncbi:hypothetical protein E2C01_011267 [Portunus trituberculatus]|uniref:Uncharacterized protein n=1 Tax=Portunus trituberculatus TaxID=210409 RepID=A0A5B7DAV0_PORTR|nr:hypothetical protein [Portunus trituberculatus]